MTEQLKLLEVKMDQRSQPISGAFIQNSDRWLVLSQNPVDYVLDGECFINQNFIKDYEALSTESMEHKVIEAKWSKPNQAEETIQSDKSLFSHFNMENNLIEVEFEISDYCLIGQVVKVTSEGFTLNRIGVEANSLGEETFYFKDVRMVCVNTDYLLSLSNYLGLKVKSLEG